MQFEFSLTSHTLKQAVLYHVSALSNQRCLFGHGGIPEPARLDSCPPSEKPMFALLLSFSLQPRYTIR